jgi:hypothetical protein
MSTATERRGVFDVDVNRTIAELERTWGPAGYHAFGYDSVNKLWSAIGSAGRVFVGDTPDELTVKIRADWQGMQLCRVTTAVTPYRT